jgi:hypothetical protein
MMPKLSWPVFGAQYRSTLCSILALSASLTWPSSSTRPASSAGSPASSSPAFPRPATSRRSPGRCGASRASADSSTGIPLRGSS